MTLPEKIGQMVQIEATQVTDTSNSCTSTGGFNMPNPVCEQKILIDNHAGSILAGGTDIPPDTTGQGGTANTGLDWANEYNTMQSYAIAHSRLHIPVIFGVDAVHGFGHPWQAPLFPQSIGMGATWDPAAAAQGGQETANALRATGWNWDFAAMAPRRGRTGHGTAFFRSIFKAQRYGVTPCLREYLPGMRWQSRMIQLGGNRSCAWPGLGSGSPARRPPNKLRRRNSPA